MLERTNCSYQLNNLDQLQKYIGNEGDVPRINKMGGRDWSKVVTKAKNLLMI